MKALGIDIGGSGIKGALVDTDKGKLLTDRLRIPTPQPSKPKSVLSAIQTIVRHFDYVGPIGVGFPGIVVDGVTRTAANVHNDWIDYPAARNIALATNCETVVRNDADVAGYAEMFHGAGRGVPWRGDDLHAGNGHWQRDVCEWADCAQSGIRPSLFAGSEERRRVFCRRPRARGK
ncbi:ROK family protein [Candidatus Amarobacter glycogenicus]|uniref:ROK family protein n=1 Tax=Candidatus Amarobacter glycogenicus TaxID=3140699 RepID=UPI0031CC4447